MALAHEVAGDGVHPGADRRAGAKAIAMDMEPLEGLDHQVFGRGAVVQHALQVPTEGTLVAPEELLEGRLVAVAVDREELLVRRLTGAGHPRALRSMSQSQCAHPTHPVYPRSRAKVQPRNP